MRQCGMHLSYDDSNSINVCTGSEQLDEVCLQVSLQDHNIAASCTNLIEFQPTNQPINQPITQPTNQSINQSINQSTNECVFWQGAGGGVW
jgi:hypothetical protein